MARDTSSTTRSFGPIEVLLSFFFLAKTANVTLLSATLRGTWLGPDWGLAFGTEVSAPTTVTDLSDRYDVRGAVTFNVLQTWTGETSNEPSREHAYNIALDFELRDETTGETSVAQCFSEYWGRSATSLGTYSIDRRVPAVLDKEPDIA